MRSLLFVIAIGMAVPAAAQDGAALYTQHCATCHDAATRAPSRQVLGLLAPDRIVASLTSGLMRQQGEALSAEQRLAIARHLSAAPAATTTTSTLSAGAPKCDASVKPSSTEKDWTAWGLTLANDRFQRAPGFTAAQAADLKVKWACGFEGEANAAANPTIAGDRSPAIECMWAADRDASIRSVCATAASPGRSKPTAAFARRSWSVR
jgi:polyvinyl alcohol dehydrogenase (cytochrome)